MEALVSVVIPTYNRAAVLEKSVRSVLSQTYANLEVIIVDDGSTDDTEKVVEAIGDPRIRYVRQDNAGACAARNHGASLAKGAFIAFHDSDDTWHSDKLEKQMRAMQEMKPDIVICKLLMTRKDGSTVLYPKRIHEGFMSNSNDLFGIGTQTILARREVLEKVRFDRSYPRYQDLEWIYRALKSFKVYCLEEGMVDYYIGDDSISKNPRKMFDALTMLIDKYPEIPSSYPLLSMHIIRNLLIGWREERATDRKAGKRYRALIRRYYPGLVVWLRR